jgi:DUF4097 and DUF4098 domain-containing protein YvlB
MIKNRKIIKSVNRGIIIVCMLGVIGGLCGCAQKKGIEESYDSTGINNIMITANAQDVKVFSTNEDKITVLLDGNKKELATISEGTMKIVLPKPTAGINLKKAQTLQIGIPSSWKQQIDIESETGNIGVSDININKLSIQSNYGDVTIGNLSGMLTAKTETGEIVTDLPISSDIKSEGTTLAESLNAQLGDKAEENNEIMINTDIGKISIR